MPLPLLSSRYRPRFVATVLLLCFSVAARAQGWQWVASAGSGSGVSLDNGLTAVDAFGNVTVVGQFRDTLLVGNTQLVADALTVGRPLYGDPFIARLDAAGNWLWAVRPLVTASRTTSTGGYWIEDTALDSAGNLYVAGSFGGGTGNLYPTTLAFDTITISNGQGNTAGFVAKLNTFGQWEWARAITQSNPITPSYTYTRAWSRSVAVDRRGNVAVVGGFTGDSLELDFTTLVGAYEYPGARSNAKGFVVKYSAAGQGMWGATMAGNDDDDGLVATAFDANGDLYVKGWGYSDSLRFGGLATPNPFSTYGCVAKLSSLGQWQWARLFPGVMPSSSGSKTLTVAPTGEVYFADEMSRLSQAASWLDSVQLPQSAQLLRVVAKLSTDGRWEWVTPLAARYWPGISELALDHQGGVVAVGYASAYYQPRDTVWCGPLQLIQTDSSVGVLVKLSALSGQVELATLLTGPHHSSAKCVAVGPTGEIIVAGLFQRALSLGSLTVLGSTQADFANLFVAKAGLLLPALLGFQPTSGPIGQLVTLSGIGLAGTTAVYLNGVSCAFSQPASGALVLHVPPGATTGLLTVTLANGSTLSSATAFRVTAPVGLTVAEVVADLQLYPNPATTEVRVICRTAAPASVVLLDALGRTVLTRQTNGRTCILDVSSLSPGMYTVRVGATVRRLAVE